MQCKETVAPRLVMPWLQREKSFVFRNRLLDPTDLLQCLGATNSRQCIFGVHRDRPFMAVERVEWSSREAQRQAEIIPAHGVGRRDRDDFFVAHDRFEKSVLSFQTIRQIVPALVKIGFHRHRMPEMRLGLRQLMRRDQRERVAHFTHHVPRIELVGPSQELDRVSDTPLLIRDEPS